jgi:hypothetical protein
LVSQKAISLHPSQQQNIFAQSEREHEDQRDDDGCGGQMVPRGRMKDPLCYAASRVSQLRFHQSGGGSGWIRFADALCQ